MRNLAAKALSDRKFQPKIVRAKRGKGSYNRSKIKKLDSGVTKKFVTL